MAACPGDGELLRSGSSMKWSRIALVYFINYTFSLLFLQLKHCIRERYRCCKNIPVREDYKNIKKVSTWFFRVGKPKSIALTRCTSTGILVNILDLTIRVKNIINKVFYTVTVTDIFDVVVNGTASKEIPCGQGVKIIPYRWLLRTGEDTRYGALGECTTDENRHEKDCGYDC